jgi:hypothetical protein
LIKAASDYLAARIAFEGKPGDEPGVSYKVIPETKTLILHGPTTQLALVTEVMNAIEKDTGLDRKPRLSTRNSLPHRNLHGAYADAVGDLHWSRRRWSGSTTDLGRCLNGPR